MKLKDEGLYFGTLTIPAVFGIPRFWRTSSENAPIMKDRFGLVPSTLPHHNRSTVLAMVQLSKHSVALLPSCRRLCIGNLPAT